MDLIDDQPSQPPADTPELAEPAEVTEVVEATTPAEEAREEAEVPPTEELPQTKLVQEDVQEEAKEDIQEEVKEDAQADVQEEVKQEAQADVQEEAKEDIQEEVKEEAQVDVQEVPAANVPEESTKRVPKSEPSRRIKVPDQTKSAEPEFNPEPVANDVFSRLHQDSFKRRNRMPPPSSESSTQRPTGPRRKIEDDLLARNKALQAKRRQQQAALLAQERNEFTGVPQINPTSRRLADSSKDKKVEAPPRQVEHIAVGLRGVRQGNTAMSTSSLFRDQQSSFLDVKVNLSKFYMQSMQSDGKPNQLVPGQFSETPHGISYKTIKQFNESSPEKTPVPPPKYLDDEKDVVKRTMYWFQQKNERIRKQQDDKQGKELDGCTFKPASFTKSKQRPAHSSHSFSRTGDMRALYPNLSPSRNKLGYASGFNMNEFMGRAQPMLNYKDLSAQEER